MRLAKQSLLVRKLDSTSLSRSKKKKKKKKKKSAFKKLLATYGPSDDDFAIEYNSQKIYLFFDVVYIFHEKY